MKLKKTKIQQAAYDLIGKGYTFILLFGGSRSGKTFFLIWVIFMRAVLCPGSRHLICRFRFNHAKVSLWYDTIPKVMKLFPHIKFKPNKSDWYIELPNEAQIWITGLDDKERVEKILGNEYLTIYINEGSQVSYDAYTTVLTRLAQKIKGAKNRVFIDCNPPTKKHWIYQIFFMFRDPDSRLPITNKEDYAALLMNPKDNLENISEGYLKMLASLPPRKRKRFEEGVFLDEIEGALFKDIDIDRARLDRADGLTRIGVAIDPAVTSKEESDETGIIVGGIDDQKPNHGYVLADLSGKYTPQQWARKAIQAYYDYDADFIVAEVNQGGDMVRQTIHSIDPNIPVYSVRATKGKMIRAEPISAICEQGRLHMIGLFSELEEQMTTYTGKDNEDSPDRLDALVWLFTKLMIFSEEDVSAGPSTSGGSFYVPK